MKLELIAKVLEDAGLGTRTTDIFVHSMPADVQQGIMLRDPLSGTPVDPDLPDYYRGKLQVIIRSTTHAAGEDLAKRVGQSMKMFNRKFYDLDGALEMKVNHIFPAQLPIVYPHTPSRSIEWSLNFVTSYVQP